MWYFAWILGIIFSCAFSIITVLAIEHTEENKKDEGSASKD